MGRPHPTIELPGDHPALVALAEQVLTDPFGALDGFRRGCRGGSVDPGHVCVTNWILAPAAGQVLLVWHERLGWAACGGHVAAGEHPAAAARRELAEETGLDPAVLQAVAHPLFVHRTEVGAVTGRPGWDHVHWNIAYGWVAAAVLPVTGEPGAPARWFPLSDLPEDRPADCGPGVAAASAAAASVGA